MDHPIITLEAALAQGSTGSEIRTLARCLDRLSAKDAGLPGHAAVNRANAAKLRRLAKEIDRHGAT